MRISILIIVCCVFFSCNGHKDTPDVSGIKVNLEVKRFENDLFGIDTLHLTDGIHKLTRVYPMFARDFFANILGLNADSVMTSGSVQERMIKDFLRDYRFLKDSAKEVFTNLDKQISEVTKGLKFVRYYFPAYKLPDTLITFIGPIDANFETSFGTQGDIITPEGLGVGLQLHMGEGFSLYKSGEGMERYPEYLSKTFTPDYIPVNCLKNIIDDLFPDNSVGKPLVEQMVEKGKRYYLLDKFLPGIPEYMKIAYTEKQMKDAYTNEAVIWDFFLNNELLNNAEQNSIKNYIGESPKTQELGEDSPGNLGSFSGWQIVKKYMAKFPKTSLAQLISIDPRQIYTEAKYRPR
jgi:hypothetical protein